MTRKTTSALASLAALTILTACSAETADNAQEVAERAAADAEANLEVVENAAREGTIDAAEGVSAGADKLQAELNADERDDPDQGDGALNGTD